MPALPSSEFLDRSRRLTFRIRVLWRCPRSLASAEAAQSVTDAVIARHQKIDVLVHLVGGFAGGQPIAETSDSTFNEMFEMNLRSAFHILRAVVPHMRHQRCGRILAIGSRAAVEPGANTGAYNASKAALVSLIRTLAVENQDLSITANVILPGTMDTPANRAGDPKAHFSKWVQPAQVAAILVHLASDASITDHRGGDSRLWIESLIQAGAVANFWASSIALIRLRELAIPFHAISNAVP